IVLSARRLICPDVRTYHAPGSDVAPRSPTTQASPGTARSIPNSRNLSSRWLPVPRGIDASSAIRLFLTGPVSSPWSLTLVTYNFACETLSPIHDARNRNSPTMSYSRQLSACHSRLPYFHDDHAPPRPNATV